MKHVKTLLFYFVQIAVAIGMLESICYFFLKNSTNPLYRAKRILQQHESWGWQAQPLLKTEFEGAPVFTDENGFRSEDRSEAVDFENVEIVTLGPSSSFGWGVAAEDTYSAKVAKALKLKHLNASQIGFSTEQGLQLWKQFLGHKLPKLKYAVIAYGVNDLDRFRFYDLSFTDDISYFAGRSYRPGLLTANYKSNFLTAFELFKNEASLRLNCKPLTTIKQRLSSDETRAQSLRLIEELKNRNVKIVVVGTPYLKMPKKADFEYDSVEKHYQEAQTAAASSKCSEALMQVSKAKSLEPWRVEQDVQKLAEMQRQLALEENFLFIDSYAAFDKLEAQNEYFVDPVHPSKKGHDLVANLILEKLK